MLLWWSGNLRTSSSIRLSSTNSPPPTFRPYVIPSPTSPVVLGLPWPQLLYSLVSGHNCELKHFLSLSLPTIRPGPGSVSVAPPPEPLDLSSASETAYRLVLHVFRIHAIPQYYFSDQHPQFSSQVWKAFCQVLGATASLSSEYHPQTDSHMEQANQYLESASNCVTLHQPSSWSTHLSEIEYAHNFLISSATGTSPFMAALGYQPPLFPIQEEEISVPSAQANLQICRQVWRAARAASSHQKREPWLIIDEPLLLPTTQGKRYGSPPATSLFKWSPVSWHLATLTLLDLRVINPAAVRLKLPHSL